jgi:uncharacterized protein YeaO (DUF488 family)
MLTVSPFVDNWEDGISRELVATMIRLKRVYDPPSKTDGVRVLIDRLWPRGLSKERAAVDLWLKDLAPSTQLRKWFNHDPAKWKQFQSRYRKELRGKNVALQHLKKETDKGSVTLLFGTRDEEHNQAVVLKTVLDSRQ